MSELSERLRAIAETNESARWAESLDDAVDELREAADEIDRMTELLATITADASWCGFEGGVSVNVTLWDIPQCDGRGGLTLLQAAEKTMTA